MASLARHRRNARIHPETQTDLDTHAKHGGGGSIETTGWAWLLEMPAARRMAVFVSGFPAVGMPARASNCLLGRFGAAYGHRIDGIHCCICGVFLTFVTMLPYRIPIFRVSNVSDSEGQNAHTAEQDKQQRLVIDIGGGSTEVIIGRQFEPPASGKPLHGVGGAEQPVLS